MSLRLAYGWLNRAPGVPANIASRELVKVWYG
jgi:hypothetical protein